MAVVAVSILGPKNLSAEAFRRAGASLAVRLDVMSIGPVERDDEFAGTAAILRTRIGPLALQGILQPLGPANGLLRFGVLSYGALVYREERLFVPPPSFEGLTVVLRSLARLDKDFQIPSLGKVSSHLSGSSDRHPI